MDSGSLAVITQGSTFRLTSSTVVSRTSQRNANWFGSSYGDEIRSLFHMDDGFQVPPPPPRTLPLLYHLTALFV